jgi:hypothetical protein
MRELREKLGEEQFANLVRIAGGTRIRIPKHYGKPPTGGRDTSVRLDRLFGPSLALLLVFHFGDSEIVVPTGRHRWQQPVNVRKLKRLVKRSDLSSNVIARKTGCSRRTVERHRKRIRGA